MSGGICVPIQEPIAEKQIRRSAKRNKWFFWNSWEPTTERPREMMWTLADKQTYIQYFDDFLLCVKYFVISGPRYADVMDQIQRTVPIYQRTEVIAQFQQAQTVEETTRALAYLVASTQIRQFDREIFDRFMQALARPEPTVRRAVILVAGYTEWAAFKPVLQQLVATDPEEPIRQYAQLALDGFAHVGI